MSAAKKILIVDDDDALREMLSEQFSLHDEFIVTDVSTAFDGVNHVKSELVDLVILDVNMPDMDGREVCKIMRRNGYKGPIVMLTAQDSDSDTILGLDSGANDYITKPFRFGILLACRVAPPAQLVADAWLMAGSSRRATRYDPPPPIQHTGQGGPSR